jgi:hypothetical protein
MSLEVYYPQDIQNALLAAEQATLTAGAGSEYLRGYMAALNTLALAFGLVKGLTVEGQIWRVVQPVAESCGPAS